LRRQNWRGVRELLGGAWGKMEIGIEEEEEKEKEKGLE